jgi:hypothetical protein
METLANAQIFMLAKIGNGWRDRTSKNIKEKTIPTRYAPDFIQIVSSLVLVIKIILKLPRKEKRAYEIAYNCVDKCEHQ